MASKKPESEESREKRLSRIRGYYHADKDRKKSMNAAWRLANPEKVTAGMARWRAANKEKVKEGQAAWHRKNGRAWMKDLREGRKGPFGPDDGPDWQVKNRLDYLEKKRASTNRRRREVFLEALSRYGGDPPVCYCCGENIVMLLGLDHVSGGGNSHRKEYGNPKTSDLARRLGWPPLFRVACHSCNLGSHLNGGTCPHQKVHSKAVSSE